MYIIRTATRVITSLRKTQQLENFLYFYAGLNEPFYEYIAKGLKVPCNYQLKDCQTKQHAQLTKVILSKGKSVTIHLNYIITKL